MYVGDILSLHYESISRFTLNSLMYYAVMPLVICNICMTSKKQYYVNINSSMYFLNQSIAALDNEEYHNIIVILMLLHHVPNDILIYSEELPRQPATYTEKWTYKKNSQAVKLQDNMMPNYNDKYIEAFVRYLSTTDPKMQKLLDKKEEILEKKGNAAEWEEYARKEIKDNLKEFECQIESI